MIQVNYLIDESSQTGKEAITVISMLYCFENHCLGEKHLHLNTDNCAGQNKTTQWFRWGKTTLPTVITSTSIYSTWCGGWWLVYIDRSPCLSCSQASPSSDQICTLGYWSNVFGRLSSVAWMIWLYLTQLHPVHVFPVPCMAHVMGATAFLTCLIPHAENEPEPSPQLDKMLELLSCHNACYTSFVPVGCTVRLDL